MLSYDTNSRSTKGRRTAAKTGIKTINGSKETVKSESQMVKKNILQKPVKQHRKGTTV
jgi:hypothetical protein